MEKLNIPPIFSLRKLSKLSKVDYSKIYHAKTGTYNSLTENERAQIFNALQKEYTTAVTSLGFSPEGSRIKKV
jgi:hypothetical protein